MNEATTASVNKAKPSRRQLQDKLSQSIEAHRLRLLKARGSKNVKNGRLCECRKCDVTSMKPSMMCLKTENRGMVKKENNNSNGDDDDLKRVTRPSKIPQADSVRLGRRSQDAAARDVPILTSGVTSLPSATDHVRRTNLREVEAPADSMETIIQQRSFAEYCEAFGIKDIGTNRSGSGRSSNGGVANATSCDGSSSRVSEYEGRSGRSLKQRSALDQINSTRLSSSSRSYSSRFGQKGNPNPGNSEGDQVKSLSRQLNSIHLVDSQGTVGGSSGSGSSDVPSLELNSVQPQQLENSVDKYKNVVDVLLDYIATGRSERSRSTVDVPREQVRSMEHGDSSGCSQVPSEAQTTVDDAFCCSSGKSCLWCNTLEKESPLVGQQKDNGNAKLTSGMPYVVTPSRVVSSVIGRPQPMNAFVKTQSNMGNHMVYMGGQRQPTTGTMMMMMPQQQPQFLGPYRFQPPSGPMQYSYNPSLCPTMNCCIVQNVRMPSVVPRQMSRHVFTPVSRTPTAARRRYTPAPSQRSINTQQSYAAMLSPMAVPHMYTGSVPRNFTGQTPVNATSAMMMQSPLGHMPKQATGPLYRRNTGRAHVKRVQAAMV